MSAMDQVRQVDLPVAAQALTGLSRVDYTDAFLVGAVSAEDRSGEEWARETLEGAPAHVQKGLRRGWMALGLKLDQAGSDHSVLGWELRHSDEEFALLGCDSRVGMPAELLFQPGRGGLLFATFVRQANPIMRGVWAWVGPRHRQVVPYLLRRAAARKQ
jgi:hypothetical protein